ncbi:MAG: hypothetical protein N3A58_06555 [Spirochaetes bacterium]|nr:hypothetical protein [Spirochaetota bacterium]
MKIKILNFFFSLFKRKKKLKSSKIRSVKLGIKLKLILTFSVIFLLILSIILFFNYFYQNRIILIEKFNRASILNTILSNVSEIFMEESLFSSSLEKESKRNFVKNSIVNFININKDVVQVIIVDDRMRILVNEGNNVISSKDISSLKIKDKFSQNSYDIIKNKKVIVYENNNNSSKESNNKDSKNQKYRVLKLKYKILLQPIFLNFGLLVSINNDFDKIFKTYYDKGLSTKSKDYYVNYLIKKYNSFLSEDITRKESKYYGDLDFIFFNLYKEAFNFRKGKFEKKDEWLCNIYWLINLKIKQQKALEDKNITLAANITNEIYKNFLVLRDYAEKFRFLGNVLIVLDITNIQKEINKGLRIIFIIFLVIYLLSIILISLISKIFVKNIKILENWGLEVSKGNLDAKIKINSMDEVGRLSDIFNIMLSELIQKYHLERYVSKGTINLIKDMQDKSQNLNLKERRNFAFLFSDIRGFTSFSEKSSPDDVISILNIYLDAQSKIIKKNKGDIDNFVGDQVVAHFKGEKRVDNCIRTAIEIINYIEELNIKRKKDNLPIFEVGIGLHMGDVVVGNIGSDFRMLFTCIGDAVNTTARLCSIAKPMEILCSEEIYLNSKSKEKFVEFNEVKLKGKEKEIKIYKIKM